MQVLVAGATGYIGSVVAERLVDSGIEITALLRDPAGRSGLPAAAGARDGDLASPSTLAGAVGPDVDAVVHLAPPSGDEAVDAAAIEALLAPLRGTGRTFVYASGLWVLGATGPDAVDETAAVHPIDLVAYRPALEQQVLEAVRDGVRGIVLRPAVTHGRGGGIPALLVERARADGAGRYVDDADVTWPMVHVDDLADAFVLAIHRAAPGTLLHVVTEEAVPVTGLAAAAAHAAGVGGRIRRWPLEDARTELGEPFAQALALSQSVSGANARRQLGWRPRQLDALSDLSSGSYAPVLRR